MSLHDTQKVYELAGKVNEELRGVADALARELVFMNDTLEELRKHISEHGAVEWYENGKQACWREAPALKSYTALLPRYSALYKQLVSLLPADAGTQGDELDEWLAEH